MTDTDREALAAANRLAQRAFHTMLVAGCHGDPEDSRTRAYVAAERLVDELLADAQWEKSKAAMDELQRADLDAEKSDHHVYPAGVGR